MINLEIIAIFITPILGVIILNKRYLNQTKELLLNYLNILCFSNIITNIIIYLLKNHTVYTFTTSFFLKYSITNVIVSVFVAMIMLILRENTKFTLKGKKDEEKINI